MSLDLGAPRLLALALHLDELRPAVAQGQHTQGLMQPMCQTGCGQHGVQVSPDGGAVTRAFTTTGSALRSAFRKAF